MNEKCFIRLSMILDNIDTIDIIDIVMIERKRMEKNFSMKILYRNCHYVKIDKCLMFVLFCFRLSKTKNNFKYWNRIRN